MSGRPAPKVGEEVRAYFEKLFCIPSVARSNEPGRDYTSILDQLRWDAFRLGYRAHREGLV